MEYVAIASTLVSAYGQYSAGKYQKSMYQKQADWAEIQGESEALAYERAGNEALNKTLRTMATINARASAGNLNPFTGSAGNLQSYELKKGIEDYSIALDSADIKRKSASYQAGIYRTAGKQAVRTGIFNAFGQIGQGYMMYKAIGSGGNTTSDPTVYGPNYPPIGAMS